MNAESYWPAHLLMIDIGTPDRGAEPRAFTTPEGRWKPITADGIEPGAAAVSAGADGPVHSLGRR